MDEQYDSAAINTNRDNLTAETARATAAEQTNATDINAETQRATTAEQTNTAAITNETARATAAEQTNAKGVADNKAAISTNTGAIANHETRITDNTKGVADNKAAISANTGAIAKHETRITNNERTLSNHEGRIQNLEADRGYGSKFNDLKNQVESNRKHASAGTSSAMAMANIPQVLQDQTFAVGAGVGGYDGENGIAVGFSARVSESLVVKATVSDDSQQNVGYGAGVTIGW